MDVDSTAYDFFRKKKWAELCHYFSNSFDHNNINLEEMKLYISSVKNLSTFEHLYFQQIYTYCEKNNLLDMFSELVENCKFLNLFEMNFETFKLYSKSLWELGEVKKLINLFEEYGEYLLTNKYWVIFDSYEKFLEEFKINSAQLILIQLVKNIILGKELLVHSLFKQFLGHKDNKQLAFVKHNEEIISLYINKFSHLETSLAKSLYHYFRLAMLVGTNRKYKKMYCLECMFLCATLPELAYVLAPQIEPKDLQLKLVNWVKKEKDYNLSHVKNLYYTNYKIFAQGAIISKTFIDSPDHSKDRDNELNDIWEKYGNLTKKVPELSYVYKPSTEEERVLSQLADDPSFYKKHREQLLVSFMHKGFFFVVKELIHLKEDLDTEDLYLLAEISYRMNDLATGLKYCNDAITSSENIDHHAFLQLKKIINEKLLVGRNEES